MHDRFELIHMCMQYIHTYQLGPAIVYPADPCRRVIWTECRVKPFSCIVGARVDAARSDPVSLQQPHSVRQDGRLLSGVVLHAQAHQAFALRFSSLIISISISISIYSTIKFL